MKSDKRSDEWLKDNSGTVITNDVGLTISLTNFSLSALTKTLYYPFLQEALPQSV